VHGALLVAMAFSHPEPSRFQRGSQRLSISVPSRVFESLVARSNHEGRSISNLCAFLLESAMSSYELP
jgi:hypothetical protein